MTSQFAFVLQIHDDDREIVHVISQRALVLNIKMTTAALDNRVIHAVRHKRIAAHYEPLRLFDYE